MTEEKQVVSDEQKTIDKMTVKELREVAKECGITGTSGMKKDELLAIIKETKGVTEEKAESVETKSETPKPKTPKATQKKSSSVKKTPITSAKECKALISDLRKEKQTAKAEGDKTLTETLRRRINVLKKKSRKFRKAV